MVDDALGRNPLSEELDSIWKIPKAGGSPMPLTAPPAPAAEETEGGDDWSPLEPIAGMGGQGGNVVSDQELSMAASGIGAMPAAPEDEKNIFEDMVQMVGLRVENEMFGIDIMKVQEIIRVQEVTRVPRTETFVRGVVNLRGKVIPVISLRERFSFPPEEDVTREQRIMIVNTQVGTVGFQVDAVTEVFRMPKSSIVPPPPTATRLDSEYIVGVGKFNGKLLVVLNLDKLLSRREAGAA